MWGPEFKPFWDHWAINPWLGGVKNGPCLDQKWPNMAGLSTFQSGPKGSKMVNLSVFDHLGPFWAHLDPYRPFQTRFDILGKIIIFVWNGPKVRKWSKTLKLTILVPLDPFGPLWSVDKPAMFGHFWSKMDHFRPSPVMKSGPKSKKKWLITTSPMCGLLVEPQFFPFGTYIWSQSMKNVRNRSKFNEQVAVFAIILPWMASYGSERSFLLIFSARDDLVKVSWKSAAWKCQNQLTPPYFD